jgi:hypothetical protein
MEEFQVRQKFTTIREVNDHNHKGTDVILLAKFRYTCKISYITYQILITYIVLFVSN